MLCLFFIKVLVKQLYLWVKSEKYMVSFSSVMLIEPINSLKSADSCTFFFISAVQPEKQEPDVWFYAY